jgi:hypothetical protein
VGDLPQTTPSQSIALSLNEVVARLARRAAVAGVLLIGSTAQTTVNASSDYDLVVVLAHMPAPMHVALTTIDGRLADIIFVTLQEIDRLLGKNEVIPDSWDARLLQWFQSGRIVFDRMGRLQQVQEKSANVRTSSPSDTGDGYRLWFAINYNVKQTLRMLESDDPLYQMTIDLRLLYSLSEVWTGYFRVRGLPWAGEKASILYLSEHDPDYLQRFRRCLAEADRRSKVEQYTELAERTLAPLGGLWTQDTTAIQFHDNSPWTPRQDDAALVFWNSLLSHL